MQIKQAQRRQRGHNMFRHVPAFCDSVRFQTSGSSFRTPLPDNTDYLCARPSGARATTDKRKVHFFFLSLFLYFSSVILVDRERDGGLQRAISGHLASAQISPPSSIEYPCASDVPGRSGSTIVHRVETILAASLELGDSKTLLEVCFAALLLVIAEQSVVNIVRQPEIFFLEVFSR